MYQLLLCWRYLRTRYIALASIVSVTLGVATMIVVNCVMEGFTTEMQDRIHGILSDVVCESRSLEGFYDAQWHMRQIDEVAGEYIEAMSPTVHVPGMLSFEYGDQSFTRQVQVIGIDESTQSLAGDFGKYLTHPENRRRMSFQLRQGGFDAHIPGSGTKQFERPQLPQSGWPHRTRRVELERQMSRFKARTFQSRTAAEQTLQARHEHFGQEQAGPEQPVAQASHEEPQQPAGRDGDRPDALADPFAAHQDEGHVFDPAHEQHIGCVLGIAIASFGVNDGQEHFLVLPGDDVKLTFPNAASPPRAIDDNFTVVDFYESKMSEYDSSFVFVPLRDLQRLRGMIEPQTGVGYVTAIQIKLKDEANGELVRDKLRAAFRPELYSIATWRDKQGPLLAAVHLEISILNLLLFMIIAVAGFGILAIFYMIVVEKTRDIGILKALGARRGGVMRIFLGYGMALGVVGSGVGFMLGMAIVLNINEIADGLAWLTGQPVFDPSIYYFYTIPTIIEPLTITWIVVGAIGIAVLASILPARRAARLHPVEALRYE